MSHHRARYGSHNPDETYIAHAFPDVGYSMHGERPDPYVDTLLDWVKPLGG